VRSAVSIPLSLVGGIRRLKQMTQLIDEEGFELLSMARPLVMEPDLIGRMQRGEVTGSRCEPCNRCIALMDKGAVACPLVNTLQEPRCVR
jgi:2,4-dienoyl-CoA reductase-like NADH-dependent reductase (Old Yellow Enzyme family)